MKITRYFNDYYDGLMAYGHDDRLIYVRKTEQKSLPDFLKSNDSIVRWCGEERWMSGLTNIRVMNFAIIFCGELYLGRRIEKQGSHFSNDVFLYKPKYEFFYDRATLVSRFPSLGASKSVKEEKKIQRVNAILGRGDSLSLPDAIRPQFIHGLREWAIINRVSVAAIHYSNLEGEAVFIENPRLADYEFFRVVDPATAFQNLEMWLGGVVSQGENNIVKISDKDRISQHGFDHYSFRKCPEKSTG